MGKLGSGRVGQVEYQSDVCEPNFLIQCFFLVVLKDASGPSKSLTTSSWERYKIRFKSNE